MGRVIVYIASSLDGFIARTDDDVSWLDPFSAGDEDYGYADFMKNVGTAIMGARTYEQSLLHPGRILTGVKNYVVTRRELPRAGEGDVIFWHGTPADLITKIGRESEKDVFIVGGGKVVSRFLDDGLVDELRVFIVPVVLTEGIPLFTGLRNEKMLTLIKAVPYPRDIVELRYFPVRPVVR